MIVNDKINKYGIYLKTKRRHLHVNFHLPNLYTKKLLLSVLQVLSVYQSGTEQS